MVEKRCGNCKHYAASPDHDRAGFCNICKYYVTNDENDDDIRIHFILVDIDKCCSQWKPREELK